MSRSGPEASAHIDAYCDLVPRADADVEVIGPFTLFVGRGGSAYYARPSAPFAEPTTLSDVERVRQRQRELSVPESFEWIHEMNPRLADDVSAAGLSVSRLPLMVRKRKVHPRSPAGYSIRLVTADDPALGTVLAAIGLAFRNPGTAVGAIGAAEREEAAAAERPSLGRRSAIENGLTVLIAAEDASGAVAGGSHHPRGLTTEITGVATLPLYRRRGLGAAVTDALCRDADARGISLCFLSAGSVDIARVYQGVGFETVGTACIGGPPAS